MKLVLSRRRDRNGSAEFSIAKLVMPLVVFSAALATGFVSFFLMGDEARDALLASPYFTRFVLAPPASPSAAPSASAAPLILDPSEKPRRIQLFMASRKHPGLLGTTDLTVSSSIRPQDLANEIVERLAAPPDGTDLVPPLPAGTKFLGMYVVDHRLIINLSKELVEKLPAGVTAARLALWGLVNTLVRAELGTEVMVLVDGKQADTLADHFDLKQSYVFRGDLAVPETAPAGP